MTPQELKASILQLAIQGKLVEQRHDEGTGGELLEKILAAKGTKGAKDAGRNLTRSRGERGGQAGRSSNVSCPMSTLPSKIISANSASPREEIPDSEKPFDIPESWVWVRIGELGASTDTDSFCDGPFGSNLKTSHHISYPEVRIIQLSNIGEDGWKDKNVKYTSFRHLETVIPRCEVHPGDFVIAKMMPAGRTIQVPELGTRITLGSDAMKFVPHPMLNKQFLLYAMRSQVFLGQVYAEAHGITRVRTTLNSVKSYVLPLPPLAEQKRIVAKIEELLPYIDRYEKAWSKLEDFNKRFPGDMQKSLLQMAIQGKLVDQRPEEGTGEELYRQIQSEKQRLVQSGKIKKEKPLPAITPDEIPFDIPESWVWVKLGEICKSIADGDHQPPPQVPSGIPFLVISNVSKGTLDFSGTRFVPMEYFNSLSGERIPGRGDILFTVTGSYGIPLKIDIDRSFCFQRHMALLKLLTNREYLFYALMSPVVQKQCDNAATGTAQKTVGLNALRNILIPLPPLAEQKRIVAKLAELLPLCEQLK